MEDSPLKKVMELITQKSQKVKAKEISMKNGNQEKSKENNGMIFLKRFPIRSKVSSLWEGITTNFKWPFTSTAMF